MSATTAGLGTIWTPTARSYFSTMVTDLYKPRMVDARNNAAALLSMIPETSERVSGKFIRFPVKSGRNTNAISAVGEKGKLPDPGDVNRDVYCFRPRKMFARAIIDGDIMRQTSMDAVAYADALGEIMENMADDLAIELNRMMHGDGSGRLAELSLDPGTGTTLTLRLNSDLESVSTCQSNPAQFLSPGDRIAIFSPGGAHRSTRVVASVDTYTPGPPSSATVTITAAANGNEAVGDWVVRSAQADQTDAGGGTGATTPAVNSAFRREPQGLAGIFSDSSVFDGQGLAVLTAGTWNYEGTENYTTVTPGDVGFQGVAVDATHPWNQAIVLANSGALRQPSEDLLQDAFTAAEETNNAMIDFILSGYGERDEYATTLTPGKRYDNTLNLRGGWTALDMKGKPWVVDRHCLQNRIYFMALSAGGFCQDVRTPFQPLDPLGPQWYRLQDDDVYQAAWVMEFGISVDLRERCGALMTDIRRRTVT